MKYLAIAAAVLLAGCSAPATSQTPPSTSASPPVSSATPTATPTETPTEPVKSERGHTVKRVGEGAMLLDDNGEVAVAFTVTKIQRNFRCNSGYSEKPKNGHYVAIWMKIQTTRAVDGNSGDGSVPYFNPGDWQVTGPDGITENDSRGNGYSCAKESISLPSQLGPSKKVVGVVVIDTRYTKGHLALVQDFDETGWEWVF